MVSGQSWKLMRQAGAYTGECPTSMQVPEPYAVHALLDEHGTPWFVVTRKSEGAAVELEIGRFTAAMLPDRGLQPSALAMALVAVMAAIWEDWERREGATYGQ